MSMLKLQLEGMTLHENCKRGPVFKNKTQPVPFLFANVTLYCDETYSGRIKNKTCLEQ